jgi:hypothetical protein
MQLKTEPHVLNCMLVVNLNVNIWSARRKLNPEDFKHAQLPPEGLASLGSKKICDPKALRIFGALKARAVSLLDKSGVRFIGGWGIPEGKAAELIQGLEAIAGEYQQAKADFMSNYDQAVQGWIADNPGWEQVIASSVVSADYVAQRIAFNWQVFKVVNPTGGNRQPLDGGLSKEVAQLGTTLFDEIAKSAREAWDKSYLGKTVVTRKALSPLKTIQQKLADLSFIEPKVAPVAELIQSAFDKIPARGAVVGTHLLMLQGLVSLLSDTPALLAYAQEIIEGRSGGSILDCLMQSDSATKRSTKKESQAVAGGSTESVDNQLLSLGLW